ncbi:MAG: CPBP family intramembrane glutamic endopeptidase, partial [Bacteroidota bacterium]
MIEFKWNPEILFFIIAVGWTSVGFAFYLFLARNKSLSLRIWSSHPDIDTQAKEVIVQRLWGFIFMGLLPFILIALWPGQKLVDYGLGFSFQSQLPWWILAVIAFIIIAGAFAAAKPGNLAVYPQIRSKQWSPGMLALSSFTWVVFLLGYEFLFRGFLLFASVAVMDVWAAIALNCALYAFAHLYKGPGETFGTIPLGILLCYFTLLTGNIWTALVIHSTMALSNEWWSLRANQNMHISRK